MIFFFFVSHANKKQNSIHLSLSKIELEIKDNCPALVPPTNGDVSCSRSRHRSQNFHRTKCSVWCHEGFTLIGPSIRYCNGSTGFWDSAENSCVRKLFAIENFIESGSKIQIKFISRFNMSSIKSTISWFIQFTELPQW